MKKSQMLKQAWNNLVNQKKRSFLTGLSIMLAMLIVVFLLSFAENNQQSLKRDIQKLERNSQLVLLPKHSINAASPQQRQGRPTLPAPSGKELDALFQAWDIQATYSFSSQNFLTTQIGRDPARGRQILFTDERYFKTHALSLDSGRFFNAHDIPGEKFAIVGAKIAALLRAQGVNNLFIENIQYTVIGTLKSESNIGSSIDIDQTIWLKTPIDTFQNRPVEKITFKVSQAALPLLKKDVLKRLDMAFPSIQWHTTNTGDFLKHLNQMFNKLNMILFGISFVCTLTASINLANSLYFSILERKKEIAIRLAIGAQPWQIRNMFLTETLLLCTISGLSGAVIAETLTALALYFTGSGFQWLVFPPIVGFSMCVVVGFIAAYVPARSTTTIKPLDILRSDI